MAYVSAKYQLPGPFPMPEGSPKQVLATDAEGTQYAMTEDSQEGDWLRYLEGGGTIDPAGPAPLNSRIVEAPNTLFGGPTIAQVLGERG